MTISTIGSEYYAGLGDVYMGYSIIILALGIFFSAVLRWIGTREREK